MAERASLSETNVSALFEVLKTLRGLSSGSWGQKKNLRALFYCSFSWRIQISHLQQHLRTTVHHHNKFLVYIYIYIHIYIYIYIYTHTHTHTYTDLCIYVCASDFYSFTADFVMYVCICVCVCIYVFVCDCTFSCTANPNATAYTDCSARSSSLYTERRGSFSLSLRSS